MSTGLWMLAVLAVLVIGTGLPVWALLLGVASAFTVGGLATGSVDTAILNAAGPRVLNLLISDVPGDNPADIASGPTVADPTNVNSPTALGTTHSVDQAAGSSGGFVFYELGVNTAQPTLGLPTNRTISSIVNPTVTFHVAPFRSSAAWT